MKRLVHVLKSFLHKSSRSEEETHVAAWARRGAWGPPCPPGAGWGHEGGLPHPPRPRSSSLWSGGGKRKVRFGLY